ncbi:MAG: type II toxin-antitoxin system VapB family antitoxin [Deltaproteobacteria bacterium]|nr:type II toxin-antitoxin system VapB family antitoxin [Deltaproteobacteria bacterium]
MGRTSIVIDDDLIEQAMELTEARSKREVVDLALRRLVASARCYRGLREMRGRFRWRGDIDAWRWRRASLDFHGTEFC